MNERPIFPGKTIEQLMLDSFQNIGAQLKRQADVMETDLEEDRKVSTEEEADEIRKQVMHEGWISQDFHQAYVHSLGKRLEQVQTATYLSDMDRARAFREFIEHLKKYEFKSD